ncbi:MAG: hypothetical protein NTY47_03135, partial [Candidatus Omnitrophica bacterium]|nr:hypothetical protein [Candidatus Omnitrophota bacterium]
MLPTEYESMAYAVAHGYVESGVLNKLSGDEAFVSAVTGSVGALGTLKDGILLKLKQSSSQSSDSTGVGNKDWKANDVVQNRKTNQIGVVYGTPLTTKGEKVVVVEFDNGETSKYSLDEAANALSLIGLNRAQAIEEGSPQADRRSELLPMTKEVDTIITTLIHDAAGANEQVLEEKYYEAEMQCSERILAIEDILRKEYQGAPPQEIMNAYAATLAITSVAFYEDIFSECKLQLGKRAGIALSLIVDKYDKQAVEGKLWSFMAKLASPLTDEKIRNIRLKIPVVVTPMNGLEELKKLQNSVGWFEMSFSVIYPEGVPSPLILITKGEGIVTIAKLAELFWAQFHTHYYVVPLKASDTDMQFCSYYAKEGKKVGIIGFGEKDGHVEVAMYSSVDKKFIYTRTNQAHVAEILENAGLLQQGVPPDMGGIGFLSHIFERIKQRVTGGAHTNLNNNENDVLLWGLLSVDQADREATTRLIAKLSKKEQEALRQRAALWQRKDALARLEDAFAEIALGRPRLMPPDNILKDLSPDAREYYWALANAPELMQKLLTAPDLHSCVAVVREMIKEYELKPVVGRDQDLKVFGKEANESWDDYFNSSSYKALRAKLINYSDFNSAEIEILDSTLRLLMKEAPELFELIFMYLIQIRKADAEISKIMADNSYRGYCWKGAMYLGDQVNKTFSDEHGLARTMVHEFMHGLLNNRTGTGRSGAVAEALAIKVETELMVVESLELENSFVELSRLDTEKSQGEIEKEIAHIRHYWDELRSTMRRQVDDDATDRGHWGRGQDAIVEAMIAALRAYEVPIDRSSRDFFVVHQISPDDERYVGDSTRISVPLSSESGKSDGAGARLLPTVPETTAPLQQSAMSQSATTPGGIDFRFLPIVTQSLDSLKLSLRGIPQSDLQRINLIQEWSS